MRGDNSQDRHEGETGNDGVVSTDGIIVGDVYELGVPVQTGVNQAVTTTVTPVFDGENLGFITVGEAAQNFKVSYAISGNPTYLYAGQSYTLTIKIKNIGTANMSQANYSITSPQSLSITGSLVNILGTVKAGGGEKLITLTMQAAAFNGAEQLVSIPVRVTSVDGQNEWNDAINLRFFRETMSIYVRSVASEVQGVLISPDRTSIPFKTSGFSGSVTVPRRTDPYILALSGANYDSETKYAVGVGSSPATNGEELTNSGVNEPNNTEVQTTALFRTQTLLGYLGVYDLDFYSVYGLSQAEAVSFNPSAGTYATAQNVSITNGLGGTLRYTPDGTDPTETSPLYTVPVSVDRNLTIKARAFDSALPNLVFSAEYIFRPETPAISLAAGSYSDIQTATLTCGIADAEIRYTMNGSDPSATSGAVYASALSIDRSLTLKAAAFHVGWTPSEVASRGYILKAATPAVSSSGSGWAISCATPGATIRYSTDLGEPSSASTLYSAGSIVGGGSTVIKARAWKGAMDASDVGASSAPPVPAFTANQSSVNNPSSFDASATTDVDSTAAEIQVRWDWTNDGTWDTDFSVTKTAQYTYSAVGAYTIRLEAKDKWGVTAQATKAVTIASYYLSNFELISVPAGSLISQASFCKFIRMFLSVDTASPRAIARMSP